MARNSFKSLEEEESVHYPGLPPRIEHNLQSNMRTMKVISQIIEVYLPNVVDFLIMATGGDPNKNRVSGSKLSDAKRHIDNKSDPASFDNDIAPQGPSNPNNETL